jgi:hypothetical protein
MSEMVATELQQRCLSKGNKLICIFVHLIGTQPLLWQILDWGLKAIQREPLRLGMRKYGAEKPKRYMGK